MLVRSIRIKKHVVIILEEHIALHNKQLVQVIIFMELQLNKINQYVHNYWLERQNVAIMKFLDFQLSVIIWLAQI